MKKAGKQASGPIDIEHIYIALDDAENTLKAIRAALQSGRVVVPRRLVEKAAPAGKGPFNPALTVSKASACPVARGGCYPDTLRRAQEEPKR